MTALLIADAGSEKKCFKNFQNILLQEFSDPFRLFTFPSAPKFIKRSETLLNDHEWSTVRNCFGKVMFTFQN